MKRIYLSIPITGDQILDREKSDLLKAAFSRQGYEVISPLDIHYGRHADHEDVISIRLRAMLGCDAVWLSRTPTSFECDIEREVALTCCGRAESRIRTLLYEAKDTDL